MDAKGGCDDRMAFHAVGDLRCDRSRAPVPFEDFYRFHRTRHAER